MLVRRGQHPAIAGSLPHWRTLRATRKGGGEATGWMTGKSAQAGPHPSGLSDDEPAGPFPTTAKQVGSPPLGFGVSSELISRKVKDSLENVL